ncbi:MAG: site-specific DNA-methyltransferase, partial [Acidobacteria bacterium ACB1]|nr:site-specific DNA-methyltransferase [Acidobacteria bacterium ACB1]
KASSNEDDLVLDPFCGCGTTIAAAQNLNRQWIGIDITHLAVGLQKLRLKDTYGLTAGRDYKVVGQPEDVAGARELAQNDRYGFQWWILPLVGAKSLGAEAGKKEGKKGSDKGIDGLMSFIDDTSGKAKKVIFSVKSGHVNVSHIRDLVGTVEREKAAMGVYVTLEPPTKPMITEAVSAGFYHSDHFNKDFPKIQILTVEDILAGAEVRKPTDSITFKKASKAVPTNTAQNELFGELPETNDERPEIAETQ